MKKLLIAAIIILAFTPSYTQIEGIWKLAPQAGSLGVGPQQGNMDWWSNTTDDLNTRSCFFDDSFIFNEDGSFNNDMDTETWLEEWQGIDPPACGEPIYPHDGSNPATWDYDSIAGTLTLTGVGAHLGLAKSANGFELTDPSQAPSAITYIVFELSVNTMMVDIECGGFWWRFIFEKQPEPGSDATLSDLQVDGSTIPGFLPNLMDYTYGLMEGTVTVPQITSVTLSDTNATVESLSQATTIPGNATVEVIAADGITTKTYTVSYVFLMPSAITIQPLNATAYDTLTLIFDPDSACFWSGSLEGLDSIAMHTGVSYITGETWQKIVDFNSSGVNGQPTTLWPTGDGRFSITYVPSDFYGLEGEVVTQICAVFNNGTNWSNDGRDYTPDGLDCIDFFIPLHPCQCLPEGITFTTQEAIDSFQVNYPGCTEIEGDVKIGNYGPYGTNITNLSSLYVLTSIGGDLTINSNDLPNLLGLENLISVGGSLTIHSNHYLTDLTGLNGLENIGENFVIRNSFGLTSLTGLENLTVIGGNLTIGVFDYGNPLLLNLQGLEGVSTIQGNLEVISNDALNSLSGLDNIISVDSDVSISYNDNLADFNPLTNLNTIGGGLDILWNYSLMNLSGLENVSSIGGKLWIEYNHSMSGLNGLDNLISIGQDCEIYGNENLMDFSGLGSLQSVAGSLEIGKNSSLISLSDLDDLIFIGSNLIIYKNESLENLTGLENIESGSISYLNIENNTSLASCDVQSICEYLANSSGTILIQNNAPGCNSPEEVEEACIVGIEEQQLSSLSIYPNPSDNGSITITLDNPHNLHLTCFNIFGLQVHKQEVRSAETVISVSTWTPGIYLVVVYEEGRPVGRSKFVVR